MSDIILDEKHQYRVAGKKYPGVNEIIRLAGLGTDYFGEAAERKKNIGIAVHKAIALDLAANLDFKSLSGPVLDYFKGYQKFKADFQIKPFLFEKMLFSEKWGFCGMLDFVGMVKDVLTLVDWKCSKVPAKEVSIQLGAYETLLIDNKFQPVANRMTVHLFENGDYKIHEHKDERQMFLAALLVAKRIVADKFGGDYGKASEARQ